MAGLATAIRLASKGHQVSVFEKNPYPGGKLSEMKLGPYRFDKGPSLFTWPELVEELTEIAGVKNLPFNYIRLSEITRYFYPDGTKVIANSDPLLFAKELKEKLGEEEALVLKHLKKSAFYFQSIRPVFLEQSLPGIQDVLRPKVIKGLFRSFRLPLRGSMHQKNAGTFKSHKTVQLFDRYATYNGSDPYRAPALLNLIPHLELNRGAYLPVKGMHQITEHLFQLAKSLGVRFYFNQPVQEITLVKQQAMGLISNGRYFPADLTVSDVDMHLLYKRLLPDSLAPEKLLRQEKSSSAYVFYWGIRHVFPQLGLHNILFSENYREEFRCLFEAQNPYHDPSIYINITSKHCKSDAPDGCENWFVMVNVPHNKSGQAVNYGQTLKQQIVQKINRQLNTNIEAYIEQESILDPHDIEVQTSSVGGSLYGNASNSSMAAFMRHPNYSSAIKGLYLAGGSVHPGGGIPLCLLSAKIVAELIEKKES